MQLNPTFINQLQKLSQNRFALSEHTEYQSFLSTLLGCFHKSDTTRHYVIGTDGCHLCDEVCQSARQIGMDITVLELSLAPDILIETLGQMIPILLSPHRLLCYPFGIMDMLILMDYKK